VLQKLEKAAIAFVNSAYGVDVVDLCVGKQDEAAPPTAGWSFEFTQITVWARAAGT
jgi:hypothetical protein